MSAKELIEQLNEFNEIILLDDGFYCFWPQEPGAFSSWQLRIIADELDRLNKPINDELDKLFKDAEAIGVKAVQFGDFYVSPYNSIVEYKHNENKDE